MPPPTPQLLLPLVFSVLLFPLPACHPSPGDFCPAAPDPAAERAAILRTLNAETAAAFSRDYDAWASHWVQEDYVQKAYLDLADDTAAETVGWDAVSGFVKDYFREHPEPDPLPEPLTEADIRLYGDGAHVTYRQFDPARGPKKESRLLERVDGAWRIAGMQTVIYPHDGTGLGVDTLRTGDFLFQDLDCGPLCDAIESVTPGLDGRHFSHVGLVERRGDGAFVIEAISAGGVVRTPATKFLARAVDNEGRPQVVLRRLSPKYATLLPAALRFCGSATGTPYDDVYAMDNGRYYCSELLYDAFAAANEGEPVFALTPMTFKPPGSEDFDPAWVAYYEKLGVEIPEGEPGCNPGSLAVSGVWE